jgi:hypothetical protein
MWQHTLVRPVCCSVACSVDCVLFPTFLVTDTGQVLNKNSAFVGTNKDSELIQVLKNKKGSGEHTWNGSKIIACII